MINRPSTHLVAVLQALFVTFIWSTSWVFIKIGLGDIPPLTYAGLRYALAFLCLLPLVFQPAHRDTLRHLSRRQWIELIALGILFIAVTQGAQYISLGLLPAVAVSLFLNLTTGLVALLGMAFLGEQLTGLQWAGIGCYLIGVVVYFYPASFPSAQGIGLIAVTICILGNALSAILGRYVNRDRRLAPLVVTTVSMGPGAVLLLAAGLITQGMPRLSLTNVVFVVLLAVVNTAFAFTLWNRTLQTLSAVESNIINNTMMIFIAILAWMFLGETLTLLEIIGLALAGGGMLMVQLRRSAPQIDSLPEGGEEISGTPRSAQ